MDICFIVEGYPTDDDPFMPFVRDLIINFSSMGHHCTVIAPQSITRAISHHVRIRKRHWIDIEGTSKVDVYQPLYLTISTLVPSINKLSFIYSAKRVFKKVTLNTEVLYAHFWHMGVFASILNRFKRIPLFVACGESVIEVQKRFKEVEIDELQRQLTGTIYVGTKSYNEAVSLKLQKRTPFLIAPNGFNPKIFLHKDKVLCRNEVGWKNECFVVCFVGAFNERKGVNRLSEALKNLNEQSGITIHSCFIGSGDLAPENDNTLYVGKVDHNRINDFLCASDIFVLPTTNEGCCNAIVEALACGLPVVSSNDTFNDDILDESCSIRIDSMDISQIENAILQLYRDVELRARLSDGAIKKANGLSLCERAKKIESFVFDQLGEQNDK